MHRPALPRHALACREALAGPVAPGPPRRAPARLAALGFAALGLAALGVAAAGCGSDPAPPAPPPALSLSAAPSQTWCCPGFQGPACPLLAQPLPRRKEDVLDPQGNVVGTNYLDPAIFVTSLRASALDENTGLEAVIRPPGRCAGVSGLCGHFAVRVRDGQGALLGGDPQRFGAGDFELAVGAADSPWGARTVSVEFRDDDDQPLLDAAGASAVLELPLSVFLAEGEGADPQTLCPAAGAGG